MNEQLLNDHRKYPGGNWNEVSWKALKLLVRLGLRRDHLLLEAGCGPLRVGRLLIAYLDPGKYIGIEPEANILRAGIDRELGPEIVMAQRPTFYEEKIGQTRFSADWAVGWDVFNHLPPDDLWKALVSVKAEWVMNVHVGEKSFTIPSNDEGWSYRHSQTKGCVYTDRDFRQLCKDAGYAACELEKYDSGWDGYPFTLMLLTHR